VLVDVGLVLPMGDDDRAGVPGTYRSIIGMARDGEQAGLDALWVYDHLLEVKPDGRVGGQWEAWTLLGALAAVTDRVALGTLVSCATFRSPGLLAKMAHTIAEISAGRLILGLGAGWNEPEYRAFGYPFDHRVARFTEAVEIIVRLLRGETVTFAGEYHSVTDCVLLPPWSTVAGSDPAGTADEAAVRPRILIGTRGPKMMRLTARWADAWNGAWYGHPGERFRQARSALHEACQAESRDPSTLDVTVGLMIGGPDRPDRLEVDPDAVAQALHEWQAEGVSAVICWPEPTDPATVGVLLAGLDRFRAGRAAAGAK
jgi:alkanesulfonate monooxygenase SsuD/methylene tetrahydromethanopterin reductase-like flavin-dependent oxidoreductase (luciferase family)